LSIAASPPGRARPNLEDTVSVYVSGWCWKHSEATGNDRLVLLAIADQANDDGEEAWPSQATIAERCRISTKTVQRSVQRLVEHGELSVEMYGSPAKYGATRQHSHHYRFPAYQAHKQSMDTGVHPSGEAKGGHPDPEGWTPEAERVDISGRRVDTAVSNYPSLDPSISDPSTRPVRETRARATRIPDDFTVTPELVAWARRECPDVDGRYETAQFVDYWQSKAGKDAEKVNWVATWRKWMRKAQHDAAGDGGSSRNGNGRHPSRPSTTDQRVLDALALGDRLSARPELTGVSSGTP
jgi:Helix-turn-helix domain